MINQGGRTLRRYNANNHADLLIQAEHELPPGTILYADIAAFKTFTAWWSPAALRSSQDPSWTRPDVVHAGVFILGYFDNEMFDAAVVGHHGDAAVDSCDVAVVPPSISSSCGSGQAAGTVSSFGGVPVRSHDFNPMKVQLPWLPSTSRIRRTFLRASRWLLSLRIVAAFHLWANS
jgi:hypothetical protein